VRGEIDITKLYLKKLKEWRKLTDKSYHIPLEGSRIFIRVWQQVNGWENEVGCSRPMRWLRPDRGRVGRAKTARTRGRIEKE
jgi:hypothetical protein